MRGFRVEIRVKRVLSRERGENGKFQLLIEEMEATCNSRQLFPTDIFHQNQGEASYRPRKIGCPPCPNQSCGSAAKGEKARDRGRKWSRRSPVWNQR